MSDRLGEIRARLEQARADVAPINIVFLKTASWGDVAYLLDALATAERSQKEAEDETQRLADCFQTQYQRAEALSAQLATAERQVESSHARVTALCEQRKLIQDQLRVYEEALKKAAQFIEYARYELEPGELQHGDQFPRQGCADKMLKQIAAALATQGDRSC